MASSDTTVSTVKIRAIQALAPIVSDLGTSGRFYGEALGLPLEGDPSVYLFTTAIPGLNHFGLWRLDDAARSCFNSETWPADRPLPQVCIEFDVDDVEEAVRELEDAGCEPLQPPEVQEEWGTTVVRYLSPEGLVIVIGQTPEPER